MRNCILGCVLGLAGCISAGGDGNGTGGQTVNLVGATPEAAAVDVAEVVCRHMDTCPDVSVECSSSGFGSGGSQGTVDVQCQAQLHKADTGCEDDIRAGVIEIFETCGDQPNFDKMLTDCINALTGQCTTYTQEDLDRLEAALESGDDSALDDLRQPQPTECEIIEPCINSRSSAGDSSAAPSTGGDGVSGGSSGPAGGPSGGVGGAGGGGGGVGGASGAGGAGGGGAGAPQDAGVPADG